MNTVNFNLSDYTQHILKVAEANGCSISRAFGLFIANLATMHEHYKGAPGLNYAELGQKWNALSSTEKISQKDETRNRLAKYMKQEGKV